MQLAHTTGVAHYENAFSNPNDYWVFGDACTENAWFRTRIRVMWITTQHFRKPPFSLFMIGLRFQMIVFPLDSVFKCMCCRWKRLTFSTVLVWTVADDAPILLSCSWRGALNVFFPIVIIREFYYVVLMYTHNIDFYPDSKSLQTISTNIFEKQDSFRW